MRLKVLILCSVFNFIRQYNPRVQGGATGRTRIVMFPPGGRESRLVNNFDARERCLFWA